MTPFGAVLWALGTGSWVVIVVRRRRERGREREREGRGVWLCCCVLTATTRAMAKVEVQIRSCFCCGLTLSSVLIALYTLLLYSLLAGLAGWAISDTVNNGDTSYYTPCELEAQGKIRADNRKLTFHGGSTTVIVQDSTSYPCSFGLYTAELKFERYLRQTVLMVNLVLYCLIVLASVLLLIGLAIYSQWFLVPWILLMALDIIRGFISVIFIFIFSHGNLARIATAIFFLGLQFFHISILMIIIAKAQRMYNRNRGVAVDAGVDAQPGQPGQPGQRFQPVNAVGVPPSNFGYSPESARQQGQYYAHDARAYDSMYRPPTRY